MIDREKVINGLECHKRAMYGEIDEHGFACNSCQYKDMENTCRSRTEGKLIEDALALLKAQEPRVLTLEEYKAEAEKPKHERDPVWEEWIFEEWELKSGWCMPNPAYGGYGRSWRCWTRRPTKEQMEATPWEE